MLSVIIPANNEADTIAVCLSALFASDLATPKRPQVIVAANGCSDDTVLVAQSMVKQAASAGWDLSVIDIAAGDKLNALNTAEATAHYDILAYLDADVVVSPALMAGLYQALNTSAPRYASGQVNITSQGSIFSAFYRQFYKNVPFFTQGVAGCGLFGVNSAGRKRWGDFPDIISDDTFVRLSFAPSERISVNAPYDWPIVSGLANLIRVRRRQDAGVAEICALYPDLLQNDDKTALSFGAKCSLIALAPLGFIAYALVALGVKLPVAKSVTTWDRGR